MWAGWKRCFHRKKKVTFSEPSWGERVAKCRSSMHMGPIIAQFDPSLPNRREYDLSQDFQSTSCLVRPSHSWDSSLGSWTSNSGRSFLQPLKHHVFEARHPIARGRNKFTLINFFFDGFASWFAMSLLRAWLPRDERLLYSTTWRADSQAELQMHIYQACLPYTRLYLSSRERTGSHQKWAWS